MKKSRQIHLWIGLLTSFLILIEAFTGLLMVEPWLMGVNGPPEQRVEFDKSTTGEVVERAGFGREGEAGRHFKPTGQGNSIRSFVKNLHAGRIGNTDVSFLLDIVAIALIILTITGMSMSIKILKAQRNRHRR